MPPEAATWVISVIAKRDAGKTYHSCLIAEEMLEARFPITVIDGMFVWWGLRVSKDGKGPRLPIVVFGGDHRELPLLSEKATLSATSIVESGISAVIDVSDLGCNQSRRVVAEFVKALYLAGRSARTF